MDRILANDVLEMYLRNDQQKFVFLTTGGLFFIIFFIPLQRLSTTKLEFWSYTNTGHIH